MPDPAVTIAELTRRLSARYDLRRLRCSLPGRPFELVAVADPDVLLDELIAAAPDSIEVADERLPYWALLWPAAEDLAALLLTGDLVQPGQEVIELGCGLGLATVAAMSLNAQVMATDYQADALIFVRLNGLINLGREPETGILDWREPPRDRRFDWILAADLAYERRFFAPLITCFDQLLRPDGRVVLGEPNRQLAKPFFAAFRDAGWHLEPQQQTERSTTYVIRRG